MKLKILTIGIILIMICSTFVASATNNNDLQKVSLKKKWTFMIYGCADSNETPLPPPLSLLKKYTKSNENINIVLLQHNLFGKSSM